MDGLPENAKKAYKFKNMQESCVSIPVLCVNGCEVTLTKQHVKVSKGNRNTATKLWRFPNESKPQPYTTKGEPQINTVLPDGTMKDTLTFLHRYMGSPTTRKLMKAIRNKNPSTWAFMTESNIRKLLPHLTPTELGNQNRTRKKS